MNVLDLLIACRAHGLEKRRLEERMEEMETAMTSLAISQDAPAHGSGGDRYAAYAARRDAAARRLAQLGRLLAAEGPAVILLSDTLPAVQRRSIREFYVKCESVNHIARAEGYTPSNIYKALHCAREAMAGLPDAAVKDKLPAWYGREDQHDAVV